MLYDEVLNRSIGFLSAHHHLNVLLLLIT